MDDLEGVFHNADRHQLLAIVPSVHHHRANQTLHNWAGGLAKTLHLVSASTVRQIFGRLLLDRHIVLKNIVFEFLFC